MHFHCQIIQRSDLRKTFIFSSSLTTWESGVSIFFWISPASNCWISFCKFYHGTIEIINQQSEDMMRMQQGYHFEVCAYLVILMLFFQCLILGLQGDDSGTKVRILLNTRRVEWCLWRPRVIALSVLPSLRERFDPVGLKKFRYWLCPDDNPSLACLLPQIMLTRL